MEVIKEYGDLLPVRRSYAAKLKKRDRLIKELAIWVFVLGTADFIYTVLIILMICNGLFLR